MPRLAVSFVLLSLAAASSALAQDDFKPRELFTVRHDDWVGTVASDAYNRVFFAACADGTLGIWNWTSGRRVHPPDSARPATIAVVAVCPESWRVAVGRYDGVVEAFDYEPKPSKLNPDEEDPRAFPVESVNSIHGHRGAVLSASFRYNQPILATGSIDGTIRIWDTTRTERQSQVLHGHKSWVNAVDFSRFEHPDRNMLVSASSDGTVRLWANQMEKDAWSYEEAKTLDIAKTEVRCVRFSPIAYQFAAGLRYGDVQLWDVEMGKRLQSFKAHDGDCWAVKYSPDGKTLITGGGDWGKPGEVKFWDVKTGKLKATLQHSGEVLSLTVSSKGQRLAAAGGDGAIKVWDTQKLIGLDPIVPE